MAQQANPGVSANRWLHQESSKYARHARDATTSNSSTNDLAQFLNRDRIEKEPGMNGTGNYKPIVIPAADGAAESSENAGAATSAAGGAVGDAAKEVVCGPLLNFRRIEGNAWYGSVLIVTNGGGATQSFKPTLKLGRLDTAQEQQGLVGEGAEANATESADAGADIKSDHGVDVEGICLYSDPRNTFWAFPLTCDIQPTESKWAYSIPDVTVKSSTKPPRNYFYIPALDESMRMMFHSCNGFSVGTDEEAYSGCCLWKDVMRRHAENPIHVMIGGGDQIYNDGIRVNGPLRPWTDIPNPKKRREYPFPDTLRQECDDYYLNNYIRWYSTEPFAQANGQIPQLNIWDDHDIIDGFGSYVDAFMKCDVFRGIGGTAHKYYLLFQHHVAPPKSTYTTDAPQTTKDEGQFADPNQLKDTFVGSQELDPGYIVGVKPGPYVAEHSLNMFARLGARVAFLGIDARTERTRHQVNYPETYDKIFQRLRQELETAVASGKPYKHLILLLGIPIAYPRLTWLENILGSPLMGPVKFLNRRFGFGGGFFNHFDGSPDLLDDLDDHYTARTHKKERAAFLERLQGIAADHSIRITILGGDVHLAAVGRFYSNPKLGIPIEEDHRYCVNIVSSAICNKPPPTAVANVLATRNKIHHLDANTDETLLSIFNKDSSVASKSANSNLATMPSRNFALITENSPNNQPIANGVTNGETNGADHNPFKGNDGHSFLGKGEVDAGTHHKAADIASHGKGNDGSLDCCLRIEVDQHDAEGVTEPFGLTIPSLSYEKGKYATLAHRHLASRSRPTTATTMATSVAPSSHPPVPDLPAAPVAAH